MIPQDWYKSEKNYRKESESPVRYVQMLIDMENIPLLDSILAAAFCWILLAGYLVFPGTFTSLRTSASFKTTADGNAIGRTAYHAVQNVSLLSIASICCFIGLSGACWLYYRNQHNYVWTARKIFLPILINSATGFFNTLINVYTAQAKTWSVIATVTAAITGFFAIFSGALFITYNNVLLARLQRVFNTEMEK
ncbi:uncharacterized protein BP01DRAFT_309066 [Aspergillus saccharolyticus JOP 1030-1]|uniref:Uncharacterized protein n=1 Tax=Aspergillus saccharolyticus JOP 1030-1 TaxID=1450539 RepID=A0A318YYK5_9EURO|nr:hypothetical protein BP01DRAFT_309066 [Aspergillus saccharolyticus JOP 1030-1]PYH40081.1 hypothetical protein BP01DRAFT_309066 [Aspergillus saccharolyticus JOP 1030-1]